jgi:hypothetical protein
MRKLLGTVGRRWVVIPFLLVALLMVVAGRAQAVDMGHDGVIAAGEVVNDDVVLFGTETRMEGTVNGTLLASGQNVVINGTVNGDVIAWTNTATINGVINGNLYAAGGSLTINGQVKGTVFLAGFNFTLGPALSVERNLFFAGYNLTAERGSQVGTDLLVAGVQASLLGTVGRDVLADVSALEVAGQIGRNVKANVGTPSNRTNQPPSFSIGPGQSVQPLIPGLRVLEGASIGGKLTYTSAANQDTAIKATPAGGQEFVFKAETSANQPPARVNPLSSVVTALVNAGRDFLTLMALGCLALAFLPALTASVVQQARQKVMPSAGWGFVVFLVAYAGLAVAALVLLIVGILLGVVTFGGLASIVFGVGFSALGLALAGLSALVTYGSKLVVAMLVGQVVMQSVAPRVTENRYWGLAVGVTIYVILRDLPIVVPVAGAAFGWLLGAVVTLVGLGAMWLAFRAWRAASTAAMSPAAPVAPLTPPAV